MADPQNSNAPDPDRLIEHTRSQLVELERARLELRRKSMRLFIIIGAITIVVALALAVTMAWVAEPNAAGMAVFPLAGGAVWIGLLIPRRQRRWKERAHGELVPIVCNALDANLDYRQKVAGREFLKPFEALELVGQWNRGGAEHHFRGQHDGIRFEMVHADLHSESGAGKNRSSVPVFYGLLFRIQTPMDVDPGLSIRPHFGWFTKVFGKQAVPTGNADFDKTFLVSIEGGGEHGPEEIRRVLTPQLQQALLELNETEGRLTFDRPTLHAGFKYDSLYLALTRQEEGRSFGPIRTERRRPFLDVGHFLASESKLEPGVRAMVDDIGTAYRVIDRLKSAF